MDWGSRYKTWTYKTHILKKHNTKKICQNFEIDKDFFWEVYKSKRYSGRNQKEVTGKHQESAKHAKQSKQPTEQQKTPTTTNIC